MGPEQAASVLTQVRVDSYKERGKSWSEAEQQNYRTEIETSYQAQANAYYSTARLWDDGIIDPIHTRRILGLGLAATLNGEWPDPHYGVFRT